MKKLLVLNDFPIVPPNHGGKIRIYNIYKHLSRAYDITYICFGNDEERLETRITETFKEVRVPKSGLQKKLEPLLGKFLGVSVDDIIAMYMCSVSQKMRSEVKGYMKECDLIVLSLPYLYPAIKNDAYDGPIIYESHNVEYLLKKSLLGTGPLQRFLLRNIRKNEEEVLERSNIISTTSSLDSDAFKEVYGVEDKKLFISPNGTDVSSFDALYENGEPKKETISSKPIAIFIGSGHPPNVDAAKAVIKLIAPFLSDVYFLICGGVCWGVKKESLPNNVGLTFQVTEEEKLELFRSSNIALNPMQSGSGTNIKMLDYMAAGLPVITTPIGARGLDLNGTNSMICEIPDFPEKIREVLENGILYKSLSDNGHKLVEEKYDWRKIAWNMADAFEKITSK